ncbi:bacillithiol system redox-active protein YtxJ [Staphylococcus lutrae]|uniref:Bacillithiol system protein YtxJ n=1 Tax=Staphylococcus lutrae TaxID=155085 RepID=A0AAC9WJG4_9STAP|nr:bacillithiol system redox-active protein YtxJ [Staphylococcus lutrae]ARJ51269.1 bacillithiol system protein YtxJ [Staphylococcus lutrae]PNZ39515.1 bacillithiol system redox-active protein YtxJ [Staphylococcus lutrae]
MAIKLTSIDQFEQTMEAHDYVFILKHSQTCPISDNAFDQFNKFLYERDMDGYYVVVQEARELSDYIAEKTGVKHESPQAFYFVNGELKWHDHHQNITVSSLAKAEE